MYSPDLCPNMIAAQAKLVYQLNKYYTERCQARKAAIAKTGASAPQDEPAKPPRPKLVWGIRVAVLLVAIVSIVLGIANGGMADVLSKAINICTECIGLG